MEYPDEDTIRILITTDNHVGYNENDPVAGDDSWRTFHEIMMIAKSNNVDMVLQGGDLFHVNKPSKKSMYQVMKSLRLACMGEKPCELELLSDPSKVFYYNEFTNVNYEDPNFNISIPVFAIAGNHDDATGESLLCPMDLLQVCGLVNHFGKVLEADKIQLMPLLFQKGKTKLALYGMASVRDERLFRTFKEGKVTFEVPSIREGEWFNLMCVHQNHTGHTNTAFLPEQFLPEFLDLVIWGHEHECIPHLVHNPTKKFDVLQPGSSVATSLCDAEAKPKNVFILELKYDTVPNLITIPLTTVRAFIMRSISLKDQEHLRPHDKDAITKFLVEQIEEMIQEANAETREKSQDAYDEEEEDAVSSLPLPLIRLRVDYSGPANGTSMIDYQVENPRRISNKFAGRVANGNTVIQFYKKTRTTGSTSRKKNNAINNTDIERLIHEGGGELEVQTLIDDLLKKMQLSLLPENGMNDAVKKFVDKDEKHALKEFIDHEVDNEVDILVSHKGFLQSDDPEQIKQLIKQVKKANNNSSSLNEMAAAENLLNTNEAASTRENTNQPEHLSENRITTEKRHTRTRKSPRKKAANADVSDSIVLSDDSHDEQDADDDIDIVLSDEEEDYSSRRSAKKPASKNTRKTSRRTTSTKTPATRTSATKTPKTDILSSLLARKRK
ncbi:MRX complex nuclease subunit TDEL_0B03650 [Torulaspora delbrueckii]|uniref:Double-strand break repair protein n=1 Tax=Torulaspora delbrueckii TaxID=4950 RepID=G8ZPF0_TORDE|nr:hypothetical protein TDEL_0B03650 [Torulaspora delbrueckii]CCE90494.1 hypothetical protein TDEL_0B03650 [Torulaspora delbrueckii]